MNSLFAKIEEKTMQVHRRVQVEIGPMEVMLAEDLSKMRNDANAVVMRIDAIKLGNPYASLLGPSTVILIRSRFTASATD